MTAPAPVSVLTAIADPRHEADLASALHELGGAVSVVRRCIDLPDLLAAAAAGIGRAVVVSPDLRRLDRFAVDRLAECRVGVVGFAAGAEARERLDRLGINRRVGDRTTADAVCAEVLAAVDDLDRDPALDRILDWSGAPVDFVPSPPTGPGRRPTGGRTGHRGLGTDRRARPDLVAVNLAAELAGLGRSTVLVDADCYGGTIAQTVGMYDEAAGVASACRAADSGTLDAEKLAGLLSDLRPGLKVLTGISRADRWPRLRPGALAGVLECARSVAEYVVVDVGFCLEDDEELSYDTAAPRRNGSTRAVLVAADRVLAVAVADPLGLTRYVRARADLTSVVDAAVVTTVVNQVRPAVLGGGDPVPQIAAALDRHAGIGEMVSIPADRPAYDAALAIGRSLAEVAPRSPARLAIRNLAAELAEVSHPGSHRRLLRRRSS